MTRGAVIGLLLACCWLGAPAPALAEATATADSAAEFSDAETRLWLTDQLAAVSRPATLTYSFEKSGTLEAGFTDTVTFVIGKVNADGSKAASLEFFTGERHFPVPPVDSTTVNPVLKVYLQGDVYEMNRLTDPEGGARERWRYFQRRIKLALAEHAAVEPHQFEFDGRQWQGYEIRFRPYANDPKRNLFERFAEKTYSVIVSDDLPGYVYRIETVVPGTADDAPPLIREVLQLSSVSPAP